ncbi:MAG: RHS repeat protein, partial [Cyanothece sp. SIO2G6]|nr:RHS repeat protein [Cyanothece sp. SIO2G6]
MTFKRDAQGRITSVVDPDGNEVVYGYDANGDLVSVTDREQHTTTLDYHDERDHYLDSITDPLGREGVRAQYNEATGRLTQLLDVNGEVVTLSYDPANSLQAVTDVFGNPTTYEYDARGNVVQEVDAVGKITRRTYDGQNNVLSETIITAESGPEGWTTTYTYDNQGNQLSMTDPLGTVTRSTYGAYGRVVSETDALGNTTTYGYSPSGNLTSSTDALGNTTSYGYDLRGNLLDLEDADGNETQFRYDRFGNVTSVTDADGNVTAYTYNSWGDRLSESRTLFLRDENGEFLLDDNGEKRTETIQTIWTYDSEGRVKTISDPVNPGLVTEYVYDSNGNQTEVIDIRGNRTKSVYDDRGQLVTTILPDDTPNDDSDNSRTITLYDRGGRTRARINEAGQVSHSVYDSVGRMVSTIVPDNTDTLTDLFALLKAATESLYPGRTAVIAQLDAAINSSDPMQHLAIIDWTQVVYPDDIDTAIPEDDYLTDNPRSRTEYDQAGRVTAQVDALGNRTHFIYDNAGRVTQTLYADDTPDTLDDNPRVRTTYNNAGQRVSETDALGHTTLFTYDDLGRIIKTTFEDDTTTEVTYDTLGRQHQLIDPEGNTTQYDYDSLGRLTTVTQFLITEEGTQLLETHYRYDELGRMIAATDANDHTTRYEYDAAGRRTAVQLPEVAAEDGSGTETYRATTVYDDLNNTRTETDFNGEATTYRYDERNRLVEVDYTDDADVSYQYCTCGQLKSITDGRGETFYDYDAQGRLLSRTDPDGPYLPSGATIEYEYDAMGNRTAVITPNGRVTYGYDERNRLVTVLDDDLNLTTYTYDKANNLIQTQFGNGVIETREYDDLNRLIALENKQGDTVLSGYRYDLNDAGHRLSVTEHDGRTVSYTYDALYRLTEENINNGERVLAYTYDNVGNRLSRNDSTEGTTTYTYDAHDRLISETLTQNDTTIQTVNYSYDANGNLTSRVQDTHGTTDTTRYIWNDDDRLVQVELPTGEVTSYEYDSDGIRVSSTVNGETTEYLLDKNRPYAQVLEEFTSGDLETFYVYGHDLIAQQRGTATNFYQVDGLGSTRVLTDEDGN